MTVLRVYEPLEAFAAGRRPALTALAADPDAGRDAEAAERRLAWRRLLGRRPGRPAAAPAESQADGPAPGSAGPVVRTGGRIHARVLRVEGVTLISPVDEPDDERAADAPPSHVMVRAWELPVAWLAVVRAEDLTRRGGPGRYVLPMSRARARAARTLRALRSGLGEVEVTQDVEVLARWLEQFHPRSWVEVDTRPVADLVDGDDGADDVRLGLESLTAGDAAGVAAAYQRVSKRSHRLEQLSVSS